MTLNELRIGNWALYPHTVKEPFQITEPRHIEFAKILLPIEITPEILSNFGFDKIAIATWRIITQNLDYAFQISFTGVGYTPTFAKINYALKYVHQLQNLYFVLTGEELIFKTN